jgi:hypothetical protein
MRTLGVIVVIAAIATWVLWELRPPSPAPLPLVYDAPLTEFAFHSSLAVFLASSLLLVAAAVERNTRERVVEKWMRDPLVLIQLLVGCSAAVTGFYGARQIWFVHKTVEHWEHSPELSAATVPVIALALVPWVILLAAIALAATVVKAGGGVVAIVLVFDAVALALMVLIFVRIFYWSCLLCSGPAL